MLTTTLLIGCLLGGADSGSWPMNVETDGNNINWSSSSTIRNDALSYGCSINVNGAWAMVSYLGIEFGPFDVSDQIPAEVYSDIADGPCPTSFGLEEFLTPDPPEPVSLAFNMIASLSSTGQCDVSIYNVVLGTSEYDLGWPFGNVTVSIESMEFEAVVNIDATGIACQGDVDGSGSVDVADLLEVIAGWGPCSGDCPADVTEDGVVDVSDVLLILAAFGAC